MRIGAEEVEESCATSAERKVWTLADALVAGDRRTSLEPLLELRQQGERVTGLTYNMAAACATPRWSPSSCRPAEPGPGQEDACGCRRAPRTSSIKDVAARDVQASAERSPRWPTSRSRAAAARRRLSEDTAAVRAVLILAAF